MDQLVLIRDRKFRPLISREQIAVRVKELATEISRDYGTKKPLFLAVLNGSFMFAADLLKEMKSDCEISFIRMASYEGMNSSGNMKEVLGLPESVDGRSIIVIEDIVDSGKTVQYLREALEKKGAEKITVAAMLFKPDAFRAGRIPEYTGFRIKNEFVVGYGMDYDGAGRNLDAIYVLA